MQKVPGRGSRKIIEKNIADCEKDTQAEEAANCPAWVSFFFWDVDLGMPGRQWLFRQDKNT